jgi:hypothetical protein
VAFRPSITRGLALSFYIEYLYSQNAGKRNQQNPDFMLRKTLFFILKSIYGGKEEGNTLNLKTKTYKWEGPLYEDSEYGMDE